MTTSIEKGFFDVEGDIEILLQTNGCDINNTIKKAIKIALQDFVEKIEKRLNEVFNKNADLGGDLMNMTHDEYIEETIGYLKKIERLK